ncbi:MAG TPA: shikimate kinase [Clostridiaceae bacterium]|nr:shikimate kinase [Clostridiaceae bacterium]
MEKSNIVLIGMPGSGKSTVGKTLAGIMKRKFIDTDLLIKEAEGRELKDIVAKEGREAFLNIQEKIILKLNTANSVIATGGSVVYSPLSMSHLKKDGVIVYLKNKFELLIERAGADRRFARNENQSLQDMFDERNPLYEKYADIIIDCSERGPVELAKEIIDIISVK